jgi:hypothetical protein
VPSSVSSSGAALVVIVLLYRALVAVVADEESARVAGLPVGLLNALTAALAAVTIAVSMRVLGISLIAALMVLPVIAASRIAWSLRSTMYVAMALASPPCSRESRPRTTRTYRPEGRPSSSPQLPSSSLNSLRSRIRSAIGCADLCTGRRRASGLRAVGFSTKIGTASVHVRVFEFGCGELAV